MFIIPNMYEYVINRLKHDLPEVYYYHNYRHTEHIVQMVEEIGRYENRSEEEIGLLQVAALWHDSGFLNVYDGHEEEGCRLVQEYLPRYGLNGMETDIICGMIRATKLPQQPKNKLEEIIADADLDYLGTPDAPRIAELLYLELKHRRPELTEEEWHEMQVSFIGHHSYFTGFGKGEREPGKQLYLRHLKEISPG
jgi:hypothetical protein